MESFVLAADETGQVCLYIHSNGLLTPVSEQEGTWHHWVRLTESLGRTPGAAIELPAMNRAC